MLAITVAGLMMSILSFQITAALAGLGIGSIVIAFAAARRHLLGGISILGDEVIRIGETCKIGDRKVTERTRHMD